MTRFEQSHLFGICLRRADDDAANKEALISLQKRVLFPPDSFDISARIFLADRWARTLDPWVDGPAEELLIYSISL